MLYLGKKYDLLGIAALTDMYYSYEPYDRIKLYEEAKKKDLIKM